MNTSHLFDFLSRVEEGGRSPKTKKVFIMSNITLIGIDIAKDVFQLCGLNRANKVQFNKSVKRNRLLQTIQEYPSAVLAIEACSSSHYWARLFRDSGFVVRLIPAQFVKSFTRGNKNDALDALAIAECALRPNLNPVQIKTLEQQDYQTLLRIRSRQKELRTATINQVRGTLAEYGIVLSRTVSAFRKGIPGVLEDRENELTPIARSAIEALYVEYQHYTDRISALDTELEQIARNHPIMTKLLRLRGIGPITAVALYASLGCGQQFRNARQLAAWIGLVPKQFGTGGKVKLGSMSKRGNQYLRVLLIHGARTVMNWMKDKVDGLSLWIKQLVERRGKHKAMVAVANKTARMVWVVLNRGIENVPPYYLSSV